MVIQGQSKMSKRVQNDVEAVQDSPSDNETPVKRKRGRPRKPIEEVCNSLLFDKLLAYIIWYGVHKLM